MKRLLYLAAVLFSAAIPSYCTLPGNIVWEVRTTGNDNNGGCFSAGSTGTDYSQQDTVQFSGTDLVVQATNTFVGSASHPFTSADVGNCLHITGGTGWTVGWYQIKSLNANTVQLDRSPAAANTTGGAWSEGGALATLATAAGGAVSSNVIWMKAGTYNVAATSTLSTSFGGANTTTPDTRLSGYSTTRGDSGTATLQATTSGITVLTVSGGSWNVQNLIIDCQNQASAIGVLVSGATDLLRFSKIKNCPGGGVNLTGGNAGIEMDEITGNGTYGIQAGSGATNGRILYNFIHDNTATGAIITAGIQVSWNLIANNTGATSDGIAISANAVQILSNTIYGSGRNGINRTNTTYGGTFIKNNIIALSGGYGLAFASATGAPPDYDWDGNAFFQNTSGDRHFADDTTTDTQNGIGSYVNSQDVFLSVNPFTAPASNDFTLNNTTGGGAALRQTAQPGTIPGLTKGGLMSFGALQPANVTNNVTTVNCQTSGYMVVK